MTQKMKPVPVSLGCLYKPVDYLFELFNTGGLWIASSQGLCPLC